MSITSPVSVWRGLKCAAGDSIIAVILISSRAHDSTVIVPDRFFNSRRTSLPAGKWRETFCCAETFAKTAKIRQEAVKKWSAARACSELSSAEQKRMFIAFQLIDSIIDPQTP